MPHRILIVDDSPIVRRSLRNRIEGATDWQICGEAEDGRGAIDRFVELKPDMVILDLQMPIMNGLEAAREISHIAPDTPMFMFTMFSSYQLFKEARAAGVTDVFQKTNGLPDHLIAAIQSVLEARVAQRKSPSPMA